MTAAESAPAASRPEGGWREDDLILVGGGLAVESWRRGDARWRSEHDRTAEDHHVDHWIGEGVVAYVHAPRESEPVMEPLPTEPCAIRATARGVEGSLLVGPDDEGDWVDLEATWQHPSEVTAWERLLSRAEWEAEQDGDTVRGGRHG